MHWQPTLSGSSKGKPHKEINNVVIFGETGVGKSSLINLLAGETISETSSSAVGCTLNYRRYALRLGDQHFVVWDTAGLDEGSQGTVPAEKAEAYLKQLLQDLAKASSVDLLIYCVRGTRVRSALLTNYHLFYSAICRKKVPIAIVITGLENQEGDMDSWWLKNERQFSALQMRFDNYACVTTLQSPTENPALEERRRISKTTLIKMITSTCRGERWMPAERSWADTAFSGFRAILSPREGSDVRVANVIMCDVSRRPFRPSVIKRSATIQYPVTLTLARLMCLPSPVSVVNEDLRSKLPFNVSMKCTPEHFFRVHQVPWRQAPSGGKEEKRRTMAIKRGADLLIFCVDVRIWEYRDVEWQWNHFNLTYGGDLSPQIVVIIGATDLQSAEKWWSEVIGAASSQPGDAFIAYWPTNESFAEVEAAKGRLRHLIQTRCIDCSRANVAGGKRIFNRHGTSPRLDRTFTSLCRPPVGSSTLDELGGVDRVDVLTKWGVWDHLSMERDRLKVQ